MLQKNIIRFTAIYMARISLLAVILAAATLQPAVAKAQNEELAFLNQVTDLLEQLRGDDIGQRDDAQASLTRLSPDALDFIDVPSDDATTDYIQRVLQVRKALEKKAVTRTLLASVINLESGVLLKDALLIINAQSGNRILLHQDTDPATGEKIIEQSISGGSFWDALDAVTSAGDLELDPYGGNAGTMVLRPKSVNAPAVRDAAITPPSTTTGILHLEVARVTSTRNLLNPALCFTNIELLTRWEPRVTPISIEFETGQLEIVDDQGNNIPPRKTGKVSSVIQAEIPETTFPVTLPLVSREVSQLDKIRGTLQAVLPGRLETFTFVGLEDLESGVQQTKSGATVIWHGYETNEDLFAVTVELSFDDESNKLDSHLGWAYDNVVELIRDDERFEAVASETLMQKGQRMIVRYLFEEDPAVCNLVYKTPAAIVKVDLDFELNNVPLP